MKQPFLVIRFRSPKFLLLIATLLGSFPYIANAYWQIASPVTTTPAISRESPNLQGTAYPLGYFAQPTYKLQLQKGLLVTNVGNFAGQQGWRVVWWARTDYPQLMETEISGPSFQRVIEQLLGHYPLYARFNYTTKTVTVYNK